MLNHKFNAPSFMAAKILYLVPNPSKVDFANVKPEMEEFISKYLGEHPNILGDKFLPNFLKPVAKSCREKGVFINVYRDTQPQLTDNFYLARFIRTSQRGTSYFAPYAFRCGLNKSEAVANLTYFYVNSPYRFGDLAAYDLFDHDLEKKVLEISSVLESLHSDPRVTNMECRDLLDILIPYPPGNKGQNILLC